MKKRMILMSTVLVLSLVLAGCGDSRNNTGSTKAENSSLKAKNSSLKAKKNSAKQADYSDQEYALMAYLKLQGQTASELDRNKDNMHWKQNNNKFTIDFGAHATVMTVTDTQVKITYDKTTKDGMGQGNGHKTYSKQELAENFGDQKSILNKILDSVNETDNKSVDSSSTNTSQNTSSSTQNSQVGSNSTVANSSNEGSNGSQGQEKPLVKNGYTYTPKYNENGQVDYWKVTGSDGRTFMGGDPSPEWQEIESEYNNLNNK